MLKRSANFSQNEKDFLIGLLMREESRFIIESKEADKDCKKHKHEEWIRIVEEFNEEFPQNEPKTMQQLKLLYKNIKARAKRKITECKVNGRLGEIDMTSALTPMEQKLVLMLKDHTNSFMSNYDDAGFHDVSEDALDVTLPEFERDFHDAQDSVSASTPEHFPPPPPLISLIDPHFLSGPTITSECIVSSPSAGTFSKFPSHIKTESKKIKRNNNIPLTPQNPRSVVLFNEKLRILKEEHELRMELLKKELRIKEEQLHAMKEDRERNKIIQDKEAELIDLEIQQAKRDMFKIH